MSHGLTSRVSRTQRESLDVQLIMKPPFGQPLSASYPFKANILALSEKVMVGLFGQLSEPDAVEVTSVPST